MKIKKAKGHPAYKRACCWCSNNNISGGMDSMEYGIAVMAYLAGYNRAKKKMRE